LTQLSDIVILHSRNNPLQFSTLSLSLAKVFTFLPLLNQNYGDDGFQYCNFHIVFCQKSDPSSLTNPQPKASFIQ